ncbi:hypothetical protein [Pseudomonas sp. A014]|uniref:hypothetical protein n=1 Tax=Pseudomonas sp. A014 TaxID=3458058 RepID=UPI004035C0AA
MHTADSDHLASVEIFINALRGSGKAFIHTSGSSVVGDDAWGAYEREAIFTDETPFEPMDIRRDRVAINQRVRNADVELACAQHFKGLTRSCICMSESLTSLIGQPAWLAPTWAIAATVHAAAGNL